MPDAIQIFTFLLSGALPIPGAIPGVIQVALGLMIIYYALNILDFVYK